MEDYIKSLEKELSLFELGFKEEEKRALADYKTNDKSKEILDEWWKNTYGNNPPVGMFAGYVEFAWQVVDKGLGYACCLLPEGFEKVYNLCLTPILDDDGNSIIRNTWLVYPKGKQMSSVVNNFIKFIKDNIEIRE